MNNEQLTMNKGRGHLLLTLLFITCYLLFGCADPFEPPQSENPDAANMGYFSLAVNETNAGRTIQPATMQSDFKAYTLAFTPAGSGTAASVDRTNADLSDSVALYAGTYNLQVTAYMDVAKTQAAAEGSLAGIVIDSGAAVQKSVTLAAVIATGFEGTFSWKITYPNDAVQANMTITRLETTGTPDQTVNLLDDDESSCTLKTGHYRVVFQLSNSEGKFIEHRETLHIYKNMDSVFEHTFAAGDYFFAPIFVTNGNNDGEGSLRQAIDDAPAEGRIVINPDVGTILLTARLVISDKILFIEGNSVIITRDPTWTTIDNSSNLLLISGATTEVSISRVHFKDGRISNVSTAAAISSSGQITLESCIFSGNQNTGNSTLGGGAVYNSGTMHVKGCTFYDNTTRSFGGAISQGSNATLTLEGNLFYRNTGSVAPVVYYYGTVTSLGYNVVDKQLGTASNQNRSGFDAASNGTDVGDASMIIPVSPVSFKPPHDSLAAGVITSLPADYPAVDFYGNRISAPAAAGAVQAAVAGAGYALQVLVNDNSKGNVAITAPNSDGLYSGAVTITATPVGNYLLSYWLVNGVRNNAPSPLSLNITAHTTVQAIFARVIEVTLLTDNASGDGTQGDLRYALTNAVDGDIISFTNIIPGTSTIRLLRALPGIAGKNISIVGNGVTITRESSWTETSTSTELLSIGNRSEVSISRIHFKDGRGTNAGAITLGGSGPNTVTLESCILSGNRNRAIYLLGAGTTANIKGCTFYGNSAPDIYVSAGNLTLEGNLFYGTGSTSKVGRVNQPTITSLGYNVVDVPLGTGTNQSGFVSSTVVPGSDVGNASIPISPVSFKLLSGSAAAGVITTRPEGYPVLDFYGNQIPSTNAAAGAVQTAASAGYCLGVSVNNSDRGSIESISPAPDPDGIVSAGTVTITATPAADGSYLSHWLVNGARNDTAYPPSSPLSFNITAHTIVQAVFQKIWQVTDLSDSASGNGDPGTLRGSLYTAESGDSIRFTNITPGTSTVTLLRVLPTIEKNITIEGNGVTITQTSTIRLLNIYNFTVSISRVHFKESVLPNSGAAIYNSNGTVSLESCIFSGNQTTNASAGGGAVFSSGTMSIKGCTFYGNSATTDGGAIYINGGTLTLEGNLFYGNTGGNYPVVYRSSGIVTSLGYNVVNVPWGTSNNQSGFDAASGDTTLETLLVANATSPFVDAASGNFAPLDSRLYIMPNTAINGFPTTDFFGATRDWPGAPGAVR